MMPALPANHKILQLHFSIPPIFVSFQFRGCTTPRTTSFMHSRCKKHRNFMLRPAVRALDVLCRSLHRTLTTVFFPGFRSRFGPFCLQISRPDQCPRILGPILRSRKTMDPKMCSQRCSSKSAFPAPHVILIFNLVSPSKPFLLKFPRKMGLIGSLTAMTNMRSEPPLPVA